MNKMIYGVCIDLSACVGFQKRYWKYQNKEFKSEVLLALYLQNKYNFDSIVDQENEFLYLGRIVENGLDFNQIQGLTEIFEGLSLEWVYDTGCFIISGSKVIAKKDSLSWVNE